MTHQGVTIRQGRDRDVAQAWNLFSAELGGDIAGSRAALYRVADKSEPGSLLAVATVDRRVVGALATYFPPEPDWQAVAKRDGIDVARRFITTYAQLAKFAVTSDRQSGGIGSTLVRTAETALGRAGYRHWFGLCDDDERVRRFYASNGFDVADPSPEPELPLPLLRLVLKSKRPGSYFTKVLSPS